MCFRSKNLYNYANYILRQEFIKNQKTVSAFDLNKRLKNEEAFKELPAKTSQQIIIALCRNWKSFFVAIKDWKINKGKYLGKPALPRYKKKNGRNIVLFDYQQGTLKDGKYKFPLSNHYIETRIEKENFRQVQIIPYGTCYKINIIYRKKILPIKANFKNFLAIDLGIDNLATLTNNIGESSIVINGKIIKSANQYYNKRLAQLKSYVGNKSSNRINRLSIKYSNKMETHFHKISRYIINYCKKKNIGNIIIGKNKLWKNRSKMNKKSNQKFIQIPFNKLIEQVKYKAEEIGINVLVTDERYTSQSSFIDNDVLPTKFGEYQFSGRRVKRGLYRSKSGILINADVNASYNILRKCNPEFSYDRIEGVSLHPTRINII